MRSSLWMVQPSFRLDGARRGPELRWAATIEERGRPKPKCEGGRPLPACQDDLRRRETLGDWMMTGGADRGRENVTWGPTRTASAGPIPLTRLRPASDPNGPCSRRSSTMRAASTGPIPGTVSISAASATSRSTGPRGGAGARGALSGPAGPGVARGDCRPVRLRAAAASVAADVAESTAAIWRARAATPAVSAVRSRPARNPRAPTPRAATAARNTNALRSACVAMAPRYGARRARASSNYRAPNHPVAASARSPQAPVSAAAPSPRRLPPGATSRSPSRGRRPSCGARRSRGQSRQSPGAPPPAAGSGRR